MHEGADSALAIDPGRSAQGRRPRDPKKGADAKTVILSTARPLREDGRRARLVDATDLGGTAIAEALERAEVEPDQVEQVVFGQVLQAGQGQIPSRQAQIKAGIPQGGPLRDREQGLRLRHALDRPRRPGDPRRRPRASPSPAAWSR